MSFIYLEKDRYLKIGYKLLNYWVQIIIDFFKKTSFKIN